MHFYDNVRLHFDRTWNDCLFYRLAFFLSFLVFFFFTQWSFVHKRSELSGALSSISFVTDTHSQWLTILFKKSYKVVPIGKVLFVFVSQKEIGCHE